MTSYSLFSCVEGGFVERVSGREGEEAGSGACEGFEEKEVGERKVGVGIEDVASHCAHRAEHVDSGFPLGGLELVGGG